MLSSLKLKPQYSKPQDNIGESFYLPCMENAVSYDRLSGYFSSAVFVVAWSALKHFLKNHGKIRVICSPQLTAQDLEGLAQGVDAQSNKRLGQILSKELEEMLRSPRLQKPARLLASMVSEGHFELKIAIAKADSSPFYKRMFHDKVGIFRDSVGNQVGFRGSMNETFLGLSDDGNLESVDVFPSWESGRDSERVASASQNFNELWSNAVPGTSVIDLPHDFRTSLAAAADEDWEQWLPPERAVTNLIPATLPSEPRLTENNLPPLRKHQEAVIDDWERRANRGIVAHATGSGKTITALTVIEKKVKDGWAVLVLVPSSLLMDQWVEQLRDYLHLKVMKCGDGNVNWRGGLIRRWLQPGSGRVAVATIQTASTDEFLAEAGRLNKLLLVADEVHRLGSRTFQMGLLPVAEARLGLSATPERVGDPLGSSVLLDYFDGILTPRYTLEDALADGVLTPYDYYPHVVSLTSDEQNEWLKLSKAIKRRLGYINASGGDADADESLQMLRIKRARISKQAQGKVSLAAKILDDNFEQGQRWLVYCEDTLQLESLRVTAARAGVPTMEYHSAMDGDRDATLKEFDLNGGVVVSMKCLDEGVDIPNATHALIVASSKNPREFIQRRGRVLRRAKGKEEATLHDLLVVPFADSEETDHLLHGEMARATHFARTARNPQCATELELICARHGMDLAYLASIGVED